MKKGDKEVLEVGHIKVSISVDGMQWQWFRIEAIKEGMTASGLVGRLVEAYLKTKGGAK